VRPKEAASKALASKSDKAKAFSEGERSFDIRHLGGIDLNVKELCELLEFAIAGGYGSDSILFGGVDEEVLGCLPD
jgi:hypothetical protein